MASTGHGSISSELIKEDPGFQQIVEEFIAGLPDRVRAIEAAISQSDFAAFATAIHQLKGSAGGYGYPLLTSQASKIEEKARTGDLEQCRIELEELKEQILRVVVS